MKADRPKQLLTLDNIPILIYTIRKFDVCRLINRILVAAPQESVDEVRKLVAGAGFSKPVSVVQGGARRQDSVAVAMQHLSPDTTIVAVHDAVRPFVRVDEIEATPVRLVTIGSEVHRVVVRRGATRGAYTLWVDGFRFEGEALDERTRVIRDMTEVSQRSTGPASLVAPMPGLIVRVNVVPGDSVQAGQGLVVMEAMKMENELRAHAAGVVKTVMVEPGKAVEKGAVLVEFSSPGEGG